MKFLYHQSNVASGKIEKYLLMIFISSSPNPPKSTFPSYKRVHIDNKFLVKMKSTNVKLCN